MMEEHRRIEVQTKSEEEAMNVDFRDGEFVVAPRRRRTEVKRASRGKGILLFLLLLLLAGGGYSLYHFRLHERIIPLMWGPRWETEVRSLTLNFDVITELDTVRIVGDVNLPNKALFTVSLLKGEETIERKTVPVVDRRFTLTFGPQITARYPFIGEINLFTPGQYQVVAEFDPLEQPEEIQKLIGEYGERIKEVLGGQVLRREGLQAPLIKVLKRVTLGSPAERQQAQEEAEHQRQIIQSGLGEALRELMTLQVALQTTYERYLGEGGFRQNTPLHSQWIEWTQEWKNRLKGALQKYGFLEEVAHFAPFYLLWEEIVQTYNLLENLENLYFAVLAQEQSAQNPELADLQQKIRETIEKGRAELGLSEVVQPPKVIVQITTDVANIRSGPNLAHEVIGRTTYGEQFEMVSVDRGWYQVKLPDGKLGWIHNSLLERREQPPPSSSPSRTSLNIRPLPADVSLADIPAPTEDEMRIYNDIEQALAAIPPQQFRRADQTRIVDEVAKKYGISLQDAWSVYLKVQGWQVKQ